MHPSLQAKYGLHTDEDVAIAEHAMAAAKKAGWTDSQINGVLQYYATLAPGLERGQIDPQAALHQLWDFAKLENVGEEQRAGLLDWHETTSSFMDAHRGELPPMERPSPETVREERAEIERIMSEDMPRYQRDEAMQNKYHDLIAASQGEATPAPASKAHMKRLGQLENLMGNPASAYWNPKSGPALQAEYRTILDMGDPRPAPRVAPVAPHADRRAEIEKLIGNDRSEYWKGPRANEIQNEYRGLLSAPEAAAPASTASTASNQGDE
jgi:hypothetical protein